MSPPPLLEEEGKKLVSSTDCPTDLIWDSSSFEQDILPS
jgi:hypothetical protein